LVQKPPSRAGGTGRARGLNVFGPPEAATVLRDALAPFTDLGFAGVVSSKSRGLGGTDSTSFNQAGLPGIGAAQDPIEYCQVEVDQWRQWHDARRVHDHVDPAEPFLCLVEQAGYGELVGHVRLHRERRGTAGHQLLDRRVGLDLVAGVVDDDGETVPRQPADRLPADAARPSRHDRHARRTCVRHVLTPGIALLVDVRVVPGGGGGIGRMTVVPPVAAAYRRSP